MAQQNREPIVSVIQTRLVKLNEAVKKATIEDAKYLCARQVHTDLKAAGDSLEARSKEIVKPGV